jgi:DNA relaxase NicK
MDEIEKQEYFESKKRKKYRRIYKKGRKIEGISK